MGHTPESMVLIDNDSVPILGNWLDPTGWSHSAETRISGKHFDLFVLLGRYA